MKKVILALALSITASFALAGTEIRVHEKRSSSDTGWQAFYLELMEQKQVAEDDTVPAAALLRDVCYRKEVTPYCTLKDGLLEPTDLLVAGYQSRNGLPNRVNLVEYRILAQPGGKGAYLPLPESVPTPVGTVPATATVVTTLAPSVTPATAPVPTATFATAQTALEVKVMENSQAVASLREEVAAKDRQLAVLQKELNSATSAKEIADLKVKITAEKTARDALKKSVDEQMKATIEAAGAVATKAAEPAVTQAKEAVRATNSAVYLAGLALLSALGALVAVFVVKSKTVKDAKLAASLEINDKVKLALGPVVHQVGVQARRLDEVEEDLEVVAGLVTKKVIKVSLDQAILQQDLRDIRHGAEVSTILSVKFADDSEVAYEVSLLRDGNLFRPMGVKLLSLDEMWSAKNVVRNLKRAGFEDRLIQPAQARKKVEKEKDPSTIADLYA